MTIRFWNSANASPDGDVAEYTGDWVQFDGDCVEIGSGFDGGSNIVAHYSQEKGEFYHLLSQDETITAQNFVVE